MAFMGSIALILYAAVAFALGWFFKGEHERIKAQEAKQNGIRHH